MSRSELIDRIEDYYETDYVKVEKYLKDVSGYDVSDLDDNDPDEGFYVHFTTAQLEKVLNRLEGGQDEEYYGSLDYTFKELRVLEDAMENYADPSFTKDPEMSKIAKGILRRLR